MKITKKALAKSKPDASREFASGERRVALTRVYLKMTSLDLDQNTRTRLADNSGSAGRRRLCHPAAEDYRRADSRDGMEELAMRPQPDWSVSSSGVRQATGG
jgi:hypothetical protein